MRVFGSIIGWLAPPVCVNCGEEGKALCTGCAISEVLSYGSRCWRCGAMTDRAQTCPSCKHLGSPNHIWITTSYAGVAKRLVRLYKFQHQRAAATSIAGLMAETFLSFNSDEDMAKKNYLLIPIPTSTAHVRERSFDHAALLAYELASSLNMETRKVLGRLGQARQLGATRQTRLKQLSGRLYVRHPASVVGRHIILLDDVVTTGATLQAAARALRSAGARSVDALVFAKKL